MCRNIWKFRECTRNEWINGTKTPSVWVNKQTNRNKRAKYLVNNTRFGWQTLSLTHSEPLIHSQKPKGKHSFFFLSRYPFHYARYLFNANIFVRVCVLLSSSKAPFWFNPFFSFSLQISTNISKKNSICFYANTVGREMEWMKSF